MKIRDFAGAAIMNLALAGAFCVAALAQTTNPGPGPSEQPNAPLETGAPHPQEQDIPPGAQAPAQPSDQPPAGSQPNDSQPSEAQPGGPSGEAPAKTDQGVGRISLIHGDVSTQRGDSGDWSAAVLNQPVMGGDKISTGDGGRMELQLDFANTFRLGPNSKANIANFTLKNIQIQLGQGIANYTVLKNSDAEPEIDTPNVAVHPAHRDGVFRIEVRPDGDTIVIVRKGDAQIATPQGSAEVKTGEMATIRGDSNEAQYKISAAPDRDDWDQWNIDRDRMIQNAQSWGHTNRYYTGSQDLDAYGQWRNVPDYGDVWVPNEPQGWAPYRDGNWTYEPYYGWTWVGYEPWGWAPYHYGRWLWWNNAWAWWPGPVWGAYRPFWAPAYVSFWGWGAGFGFGFGWGGWGGFGWLPLGPGDWFHPWWGGYAGRFGWVGWHGAWGGWGGRWGGFAPLHAGTRFSNVANIRDAHIGGALSTVGAGRFGAGRVSAMAATHAQIGGARMMAGNLPVVPSRASLSASGRAAAPSTMRGGGAEHFFGSHNTGARQSFGQETAHLQQTMAQNHVSGFTAGGRGETESASRGSMGSRTMGSGGAGKPSAGTAAEGREGGNGFNGSRGNSSSSARAFTAPNNSNTRSSNAMNPDRGNTNSNSFGNRGNESERGTSETASRDGFHSFGSSSNEAAKGASSYGERGGSGSYWNRTAPASSESRSSESRATESRGSSFDSRSGESRSSESRSGSAGSSRSYSDGFGRGSSPAESSRGGSSYGGSSRPQLDMRQPIARSPYGASRGGYGNYGGYRAPSYGSQGSRGYSAPSFGGGHNAPSGGGHSSGGHSFGGGGHSGGGHSGGGHSGGGHSGGGHGGHR